MKYIYLIFALVTSSFLSAADTPEDWKEDDITFESLVNGWSDHAAAFQKLFRFRKIHTFLEFGMGKGTKYFIDNCDKVISIELICAKEANILLPWPLKTVEIFWHHENWEPHFFRCSSLMDQYNLMTRKGVVNVKKQDAYWQELENICTWALSNKSVDLVFIDHDPQPRVDLVNALFGKVNIIAAHDTNPNHTYAKIFAYNHVKVDPNYVEITYKKGCWTTFWVKKDDKELIQYLQKAFRE
jgi:hypothetical protein